MNTAPNPIERDFGNLLHRTRGHSCRLRFFVSDSEPWVKGERWYCASPKWVPKLAHFESGVKQRKHAQCRELGRLAESLGIERLLEHLRYAASNRRYVLRKAEARVRCCQGVHTRLNETELLEGLLQVGCNKGFRRKQIEARCITWRASERCSVCLETSTIERRKVGYSKLYQGVFLIKRDFSSSFG